jgi:hypothetical protein
MPKLEKKSLKSITSASTFKKIENEEEIKTKAGRRKELIKTRADISETETMKARVQINEAKL